MGRHAVRPRYGRLAAAGTSLAVTSIALLGGVGVLPSSAQPAASSVSSVSPVAAKPVPDLSGTFSRPDMSALPRRVPDATEQPPADSGSGRRVVFSESQQRVWLVGRHDRVRRTYLVSGSVTDNLDPGTYQVYSRSMNAIGIDDSGTMKYFVRFTQGGSGAAIGFHDIPVADGERVQGVDELGTPTSHGCIRQRRADARVLWDFAPIGTTVVVTA